MKIADLMSTKSIALGVALESQEDAIDKLVSLHLAADNISDAEVFKRAIVEREKKGTTAVGGGLAVPHAQSPVVKNLGVAIITVPDGVEYCAPDRKPVKLLFMIASPEKGPLHHELLARLVTLLIDAKIVNSLLEAKGVEEFIQIIIQSDKEKYPEETSLYEPFSEEELKSIINEKNGIIHKMFKLLKKRMANVLQK